MKKIFFFLIFFTLFCFIFADITLAKAIIKEKGTVDIAKDEVINDDLFVGAENVIIEGTVNGDVFIGAGTVNESGVVNGNLHIGAGNVTISGLVLGNIYVAGGSINLRKVEVRGSVISGSGVLNIDDESSIGGSLISGCGTLDNQAPVARNVFISAGTIVLDSKVGGEVKVAGGKIDIGSKTVIGKDLAYFIDSSENFTLSSEATVSGVIKKVERQPLPAKRINRNFTKFASGIKTISKIISFFGALIIGLILIKVFPKPVIAISEQVKISFFKNLGIGFLVMALSLPALFIMAITLIGLPLAGITFTFLMINVYFSKLAIAITTGTLISDRFNWKKISLTGKFAIGWLIIFLIIKIPFLGFFISLLVTLTGLGALLIYYRNSLKTKS